MIRKMLEANLKTHGINIMIDKTIEELSELLVELTKAKKGELNVNNLCGEVADVYNCLDQLGIGMGVEEAVREKRYGKMARQMIRNGLRL